MSEMVDRVARAIQDRMLSLGWDDPRELARAAIAAMREPTDAEMQEDVRLLRDRVLLMSRQLSVLEDKVRGILP